MRKRWKRIALAVFLAVLAGTALYYRRLGVIGAGYAAEQTCACLFVSNRALDSCKRDLEPLAQKIVRIFPGDREVTARVLGVIRARARYEAGFGCTLVE